MAADEEYWMDIEDVQDLEESPEHYDYSNVAGAYFEYLLQQISAIEKNETKVIETPEGFTFDEISIREALILSKNLQAYLESLSEAEFKKVQKASSFYQHPQEMFEQIKILFTGGVKAKEEITRIYAARAIGTYKVIRTILNTSGLFDDFSPEEANQVRQELRKKAEETLKKVMKMIPRSTLESMSKERNLLENLKKILSRSEPLFHEGHPYELITKRFRELIFWMKATPGILTYLDWKQKYLKHWLYTELYRLDRQNLKSSQEQLPQYSLIKIRSYQELELLFSELDHHERKYHQIYDLKQTHYACFSNPEEFLKEESKTGIIKRARKAENDLLESLTINQLCTLSAAVHADIVKANRKNELHGILPSGVNSRSIDWDTEGKADKKYMAETVNAQVEIAKSDVKKQGRFMKSLGNFSKKMPLLPRKKK